MIAAWMLYAAAAAALLALAASAADAALRALGRPTRWAWAAALLLSLAVPPLAWWQTAERPAASPPRTPAPAGAVGAGDAAAAAALDLLVARAAVRVDPSSAWMRLDRPLLALWAAVSLVVLGRFALARRGLRRARAEWRPAVVDATPVLVAGRTGPAVAGVLRPAVVLPEWALDADPAIRRLMLTHEREHVRAGDALLLAAAAVAAALLPWNPAVWIQLRRLRLAVEIDCDRRVLRRHPDVARYGRLLLEVGRRAPGPALPLAALTTPTSLERRIRTMTMPRPRHPLLRGLALLGGSALAAAAALVVPQPAVATLQAQEAPHSAAVPIERIRAAVEAAMPNLLTEEHGGFAQLTFVVDAEGNVVRSRVRRMRSAAPTVGAATRPVGATGERQRVMVRGGAGPGLADVPSDAIASVEVMKLAPGELIPDSANVVWVQLKAGAEIPAQETTAVYELAPSVRGAAQAVTAVGRTRTEGAPAAAGESRVLLRTRASGEESESVSASGGRVVLVPDTASRAMMTTDGMVLETAGSAQGGTIVLRGIGTAGSPPPLYVIDGVIIRENAQELVTQLRPDEIDSIEVLKGQAAIGAYGAAAEHGVIKITTKR